MERDPKLISLIEASRRCAFSPEYLNVLVLRGKLKAIKIGRNWFTKDEWLKDYLQAERKVGRPRKSPPINFTGHAPQQNRTTVRRPGIVERLFAGRPIAAGVLIAGALLFMFSPAARAGVAWSTAPLIAGVVQGTHESYARNKAALGTNLALVADLVHAGRARLDAALIVPLTDHASRLSDHGRAAVRTFTAGARTITGRITREGSRLFAALVPSSSPSRPPLADSVHPPHRPPRAPAAEFTAAPLPAAVRWTPAPAVIREVPVPDPALRTSLTVTQDELARTSANFTLLRGDVIRDLAAVRAELGSLKAATAAAPDEPRTLETVIREVSRETVIHIATPPGASLGNKEITASLESGAIAPTTITIGSMTFGGSTLASIQTINSSPTVTGTLTISGTGTSTITSSLQVASYLTAGNLLTVPYFTATSTTATSTIAGGLATAGLASSNGLTLTGGSLLQTNTATSSFAGGISAAGLNSSAGLTLTGGIFN
ncbi:MAG: hypothetical protein U1A16_00835, partial [Patescibacteria group bacterium]|nr:hypothetical protein [Patescibacteria group bacterium]